MLDLNKLDSRTISIKNLAPGITEQQIYDRFSTYGHIKDISIVNNTNNSLYACVKFEHELNAREATLQENGKIMDGVKIDVEHRLVVVSFEGDDAIKNRILEFLRLRLQIPTMQLITKFLNTLHTDNVTIEILEILSYHHLPSSKLFSQPVLFT